MPMPEFGAWPEVIGKKGADIENIRKDIEKIANAGEWAREAGLAAGYRFR